MAKTTKSRTKPKKQKIYIYELSSRVKTNQTVLNAAFTKLRIKNWKIVPAYGRQKPTVIVEAY